MVKKGGIPWNKNKPISEKTRRKMQIAHTGSHQSITTRKKIGDAQRGEKSHSYGKPSWMKNKRHTIISKQKMRDAQLGEKNHMFGKHHTGKSRKQISDKHKGTRQTESTKQKLREINIGKHHLNATRQKIAKALKGRQFSDETRRKIKEKRVFTIIPFKDTKIERMIQDELSLRGYGYYKHFPIIGQPDIAFPDKKIAIFCDGDYWHNRPKSKERDEHVTEELQKQGWLVLRYWEHEINANVEAAVDEIEDVIFERW